MHGRLHSQRYGSPIQLSCCAGQLQMMVCCAYLLTAFASFPNSNSVTGKLPALPRFLEPGVQKWSESLGPPRTLNTLLAGITCWNLHKSAHQLNPIPRAGRGPHTHAAQPAPPAGTITALDCKY